MNEVNIAGIKISQNENGLWSLNDLHRASGGNPNQRPRDFLDTERAKRLIEALSQPGDSRHIIIGISGPHGGTFGVKHVLVAYSIYLSVEMEVAVQGAFLEKVEQNPMSTMDMVIASAMEVKAHDERLSKLEGLTKQLGNQELNVLPPGYVGRNRLVSTHGRGFSDNVVMGVILPHYQVSVKSYHIFYEEGGIIEAKCYHVSQSKQAIERFITTLWQVTIKFCESDILPEGTRVAYSLPVEE